MFCLCPTWTPSRRAPPCWKVRISCPVFPLAACRRLVRCSGSSARRRFCVSCPVSGVPLRAAVARSRVCARRFGGGAPCCACGLYRLPTRPMRRFVVPPLAARRSLLCPQPEFGEVEPLRPARARSLQKLRMIPPPPIQACGGTFQA